MQQYKALCNPVYFFSKQKVHRIVHPETGVFSVFLLSSAWGVKMKNPETEAISGFCFNLLLKSAEKERADVKKQPGGLF
jgi:hypothetical protein